VLAFNSWLASWHLITRFQVFFSILTASFSFGQAGGAMKDIAVARGAAHFVFNLIERVSALTTTAHAL